MLVCLTSCVQVRAVVGVHSQKELKKKKKRCHKNALVLGMLSCMELNITNC